MADNFDFLKRREAPTPLDRDNLDAVGYAQPGPYLGRCWVKRVRRAWRNSEKEVMLALTRILKIKRPGEQSSEAAVPNIIKTDTTMFGGSGHATHDNSREEKPVVIV